MTAQMSNFLLNDPEITLHNRFIFYVSTMESVTFPSDVNPKCLCCGDPNYVPPPPAPPVEETKELTAEGIEKETATGGDETKEHSQAPEETKSLDAEEMPKEATSAVEEVQSRPADETKVQEEVKADASNPIEISVAESLSEEQA